MTTANPSERCASAGLRRGLAVLLVLGLLAGGAHAGFPTFDVAAFGQRVQKAVNDSAQLAAVGSIVTNTTTMVTTLSSQLDQALQAAEGQISALTNWQDLFPVADVLGAPEEVRGWITRAGRIRSRVERIANGSVAALPDETDIRGAWAAAPVRAPLGSPPVRPPVESRADRAARSTRELATSLDRLDALTGERGAAAERRALLLQDVRERLENLAGDAGVSGTALAQKQVSAAAASGDLLAAHLQLAALREEALVEEAAARRTALAASEAAITSGIRSAFESTRTLLARHDEAGADGAVAQPVLPVY